MKDRIDSGEQQDENMNWDAAGNNWETYKQRIRERWKQLSDEQVSGISGRREELRRELQRSYGLDEKEAERQIREFETGDDSIIGASAGRGATERMREYGSGNQPPDPKQ